MALSAARPTGMPALHSPTTSASSQRQLPIPPHSCGLGQGCSLHGVAAVGQRSVGAGGGAERLFLRHHARLLPMLSAGSVALVAAASKRRWGGRIGSCGEPATRRRARAKAAGSCEESASTSRRNLVAALPSAAGVVAACPPVSKAAASTAVASSPVPLTVCLGTCCLKGEDSAEQVRQGLEAGYRWIDTASHYENEAAVAEGIRRAKLQRGDVKIITKVWFDDMGERAAASIRESLKRLDTDYVDLLLIHFPGTNDMLQDPVTNRRVREQTWRALEEAKEAGMAKAIGVANYTRRHMKELLSYCRLPPEVAQLEAHPYFPNSELIEYCISQGVQPMAFSPLAHGDLPLLKDKRLLELAESLGRTPAQVALRWSLDRGLPVVAFSSSRGRLAENLGALDFALPRAEVETLEGWDKGSNGRVGFDPNFMA
eukprot:TRINITY_DN28496_c0_g1_i3.p1 TRINITY_DN28496_c0_g1~~TRINITY_DN28496_c0_g1_i3.p1  ORF type:complete len:429 (+),score=95.24 TRINITY_DN28496_c0_g1_i3:153-1439(+)